MEPANESRKSIASSESVTPREDSNATVSADQDANPSAPDYPQEIHDFQPDVVEIENEPVPGGIRYVLYTVLALIVIAIIWASVSKVERIVSARGKIVFPGTRLMVQPLNIAVLRKIHVKVGDVVEKGQVLVSLDPTFASSDLQRLEQTVDTNNYRVRRLTAEINNEPFIISENDSASAKLQFKLYQSRRNEYKSSFANFEAQITALMEKQNKIQGIIEVRKQQYVVAEELMNAKEALFKKSMGSKSEWLESKSRCLHVQVEISQLEEELNQAKNGHINAKNEMRTFESRWKKEVYQELSKAMEEFQQTQKEQIKAGRLNQLVTLTAPAAGIVLEVAPLSPGAIAQAAQSLVTLAPGARKFYVKANIPAREVALIRTGDPVKIKLDAFPFQRHGFVLGEIKVISEDSFALNAQEGNPGPLVYRTNIDITEIQLKHTPDDYRLIAGMELTADIKIGSRRIISYLLYPVIRVFKESMREP